MVPCYIWKGVGILPSPVPYFKAFALPLLKERATQKAHADVYSRISAYPPDAQAEKRGVRIYTTRGRFMAAHLS